MPTVGQANKINENEDTTPPILKKVELNKNNFTSGDTIKLTAEIFEEQSGVSTAYAVLKSPNDSYTNLHFSRVGESSYYEATYEIEEYDPSGQWEIIHFSLTDRAGNSKVFEVEEFDSDLSIVIGSNEEIDDVEPEKKEEVKEETKTETIFFERREEEDVNLEAGETKVKQAGKNGEKTITYEVTYVNNIEKSRKVLSEEITKEPVDEIILIGIKEDDNKPKDESDDMEDEKSDSVDKGDTEDQPSLSIIFPNKEGFTINKDKAIVFAKLSSKNNLRLSSEQVESLIKEYKTLEVVKEDITLNIPTSIFTKNEAVIISIKKVENDSNGISGTYDLVIKQGDKIISEFDVGVRLTFEVDADKANNPKNLQVFYKDEKDDQWENIGGKYNKKESTVTVVTKHFSTFSVFEVETEESDSTVNIGGTDSEDKKTQNTSDKNESNKNEVDGKLEREKADTLLPNTATNTYNILIAGIFILFVGMLIVVARRSKQERA